MTWPVWNASTLLAAAEETGALRALEFDFPESPLTIAAAAAGLGLLLLLIVSVYLRDTADYAPIWKVWLTGLRLAAVAGLIVIALNPQERTQKTAFRPSRVALLIDTSLSMRHPESLPPAGTPVPGSAPRRSRSEAVADLLGETDLIEQLRQRHEVSVYTFDSSLSGAHRVFPTTSRDAASTPTSGDPEPESPLDWNQLVEPRGLETRLGESLIDLLREAAGRTLAGVVVIGDGASNAGIDPQSAHERALASKARLITVGVGSAEQPVNLRLADVQFPTDVQLGDAFEISAYVQGQALAGRSVEVELLRQREDDPEATVIETRQVTLLENGIPVEVTFSRNPSGAGDVKYTVRAPSPAGLQEFNDDDNRQTVTVSVFDRPLRVLLFAGGPMRDYRFVSALLNRHPAMEVDVLLQTAEVGVSQEADDLLFQFPTTREELFAYDVVIAFDPDWKRLPVESLQLLNDWVAEEAGGLILVAGDIYTPQLAGASEEMQPLQDLYPVLLNNFLFEFRFEQDRNSQPWPIAFDEERQSAEFLQLTDDPVTSGDVWDEFPGIYRCYPTSGVKAGAAVYARFSDPRSQNEGGFPVLMASQFYGQGQTFYLGSAEMWRLRAIDENYFERFWIKTIREFGQGRMKRGNRRGLLLPETRRLLLGQTARVRARLLDQQFRPLDVDSVLLDVYDPNGRPLVPSRRLLRDPNRPGEYVGDFRASLPGAYRLELPIPASRDQITDEIIVSLPKLEDEDVRQNAKLLRELVADTGGEYVALDNAAAQLPELLPNRGEKFLVDERLRTLWDRQWVMYLLVGLLSAEWLTRKLLKLA